MNRFLSVARIQVLDWSSTLLLPWLILAFSFVINVTIFSLVEPETAGPHSTGGLSTIYVFAFIAHIVAVRSYSPFVLGLSVTRRVFCAATSALAFAQALVFALLLFLLTAAVAAGTFLILRRTTA